MTRLSTALLPVVAVAIAAAVYLPNLGNSYVGLDVDAYRPVLAEAPFLETAWRLTRDLRGQVISGYYAPLGAISLAGDKLLPVSSPRATLLVNLGLHCLNGVLVFLLVFAIGAGRTVGFVTALIFLVHPMQSSTVLWFAERKTLLSFCFYLLSLLAYLHFAASRGRGWYVLALLSFTAALLSKPVAVVLPAVLAVSELLGIKAVTGAPPGATVPANADPGHRAGSTGVLLKWAADLVPFVAVSGLFILLTLRSEVSEGWMHWSMRPFIASAAVWFYLSKAVLPVDLMYIYPQWNVNPSLLIWWIWPVLLTACLSMSIGFRRRMGAPLLWGLSNFLVPVLPVVGLVEFGGLQYSYVWDHLAYQSFFGIAFCVAVAAERLLRGIPFSWGRGAVGGAMILYVVFLGAQTRDQATIWKTPRSLWADTVSKNPSAWIARYELAGTLLDADRPEQAVQQLRKCSEIRPDFPFCYYALGQAMMRLGDFPEATKLFLKTIERSPDFVDAHNDLGTLSLRLGNTREAIQWYRKAIALAGRDPKPRVNLGMALLKEDRVAEAIQVLDGALNLDPNMALGHLHLGRALQKDGHADLAREEFHKALELEPRLKYLLPTH